MHSWQYSKGEKLIGKDMEGSVHNLIWGTLAFAWDSTKVHKAKYDRWSPGCDMKWELPEYEAGKLTICP
jgi:hypothetical protein